MSSISEKNSSRTGISSHGTSIIPTILSEQVDIIITYDLKNKRTKRIDLAGMTVQILSLKDLIDMKRQSARPQDVEDVKALEKLL